MRTNVCNMLHLKYINSRYSLQTFINSCTTSINIWQLSGMYFILLSENKFEFNELRIFSLLIFEIANVIEQKACIKFCFRIDISVTKESEMLQKAVKDDCLSNKTTYNWYKKFKSC